MSIQRGDRLGLIGPNGAGKTTLLRLLTGDHAPDSGTVRLGANLQMVVARPARASLDPATTSERGPDRRRAATWFGRRAVQARGQLHEGFSLCARTGPHPNRRPVGRRARPLDAGPRPVASPSNLLVLDEPTNDLDLETLDLLQETLADYPGAVILVSHDRDFLDRTATSVLARHRRRELDRIRRWLFRHGCPTRIGRHGAHNRERS